MPRFTHYPIQYLLTLILVLVAVMKVMFPEGVM